MLGSEDSGEAAKEASLPRKKGNLDVHASVFLAVIGRFPELNSKKIFVWGNRPEFSRYLSELPNLPRNIVPIDVEVGGYGYFYPLDTHPNAKGHRKIAETMTEALKEAGAL